MKVGLLGTGLMGAPLASRLVSLGHTLAVWNRSPGRSGAIDGAQVVEGAADAVAASELVVLALSDYDAITEVLFHSEVAATLGGRTVVQMGTIAPVESRRLSERVIECGGDYLEAPVLGSIPEARAGTLLVMVGGPAALFERRRELLAGFGPAPRYIGPVGQAAALKLALNQLIAGLTSSFALSLGLVRQAGVQTDLFMSILRDSALYAPTFDKKLQRMLERDYGNPNFPVRHLVKDVDLFLDAAGESGLDVGILLAIRELLGDTLVRGLQDGDYSALYDSIDPP